ncbi:MAG: DUF3524 domain-containing protein [Mariniblastus sp.]|nr:DUF3524 domain-containing protein [Mariniblastus sp.]
MDGWIQNSAHQWQDLLLPPRHWKWRMRQAALYFAEQVDRQWEAGTRWDSIFTTDMLNVAEFRGLLKTEAREVPIGIYFHENQVAYPNRHTDPRDLHFAFTNLTSTLAADYVWFNSQFNRDSLVSGLKEAARQWPDFVPLREIETIPTRSQVEIPGIQLPPANPGLPNEYSGPVHLVWAARWEHDKNPADLLQLLRQLQQRQIPFSVSIIGQSFREQPPEFEQIQQEFHNQIVHWGYQSSRTAYWKVLSEADLFLSTAIHEFYGLAVMEGLASGLITLLPNRLAYPEISQRFQRTPAQVALYDTLEQCVNQIAALVDRLPEIRDGRTVRRAVPQVVDTTWPRRGAQMDLALARAVESACRNKN